MQSAVVRRTLMVVKIVLVGLAASALLAGPAVVAAPAHAEDQRPCVSNREFNSIYIQTQESLEHRWEVVRLGRQRQTPVYGPVVAYPWCGHAMGDAWVGIEYGRRGVHELALGIVLWKRDDDGDEAEPPTVTTTEPPTVISCGDSCW